MRYFSVLYLAGFGTLLVSWMGQTPAFNSDLRIEAIDGDEIQSDTSTMYSHSDYLFSAGYSYIFPDLSLILSDDLSELQLDVPIITAEEIQNDAQLGIEHLTAALALAPADAYSWMTLAWGYALSEASAGVILEPLRQSWKYAPHDRILADRRLALVATLYVDSPDVEAEMTDQDLAAIATDISVMKKFDPGSLAEIIATSPEAPYFAGLVDG